MNANNDNSNTDDDTSSDEAVSQFLAITGSSDPSQAKSYLEMSANDLQAAICLFLEHQGGGGGGMGGMSGGGSSTGSGRNRNSSRGTNTGGGGNNNSLLSEDGIRAPDQTRTMRLMDFEGGGGMGGMGMGMGVGPSAFGLNGANPSQLAGLMNHPILGPHAAAALMNVGGSGSDGMGMGVEMPVPNMSAFADDDNDDIGSGRGNVRDRINALAAGNSTAAAAAAAATASDGTITIDGNTSTRTPLATTTDASASSALASSLSTSFQSRPPTTQRLADMFAAPSHLIHRAGGFQGARNVAKDSRRWLLVNLQCDADFACHALNRDVWRDELVENLVREGFVFWQDVNSTPDGRTYEQRYNVESYPHIAIIDPRTSRLIFRKEGWTQENPLTAEKFAEYAADFCSRNSFDKPPSIPRSERNARSSSSSSGGDTGGGNIGGMGGMANPAPALQQMTEEEQLQAAIRASMNEASGVGGNNLDIAGSDHMSCDNSQEDYILEDSDDEDDNGTSTGISTNITGGESMNGEGDNTMDIADTDTAEEGKEEQEEEAVLTFHDEIIAIEVGEEPTGTDGVARIMIRMPDGKRLVRKFKLDDTVKVVYAFVSQSNEDAKGGKEFEIKAGFPPKNLLPMVDDTIQNSGLAGDSVTVRWKEE